MTHPPSLRDVVASYFQTSEAMVVAVGIVIVLGVVYGCGYVVIGVPEEEGKR
jgi:hypothetical protein